MLLELDLVICHRLAFAVEDKEARRGSALVDAADEPVFPFLVAGLADALGQGIVMDMDVRLRGEGGRSGQLAVLDELDCEDIWLLLYRGDEADGAEFFVETSPLVIPSVLHCVGWPGPNVGGCGNHLEQDCGEGREQVVIFGGGRA